MKQNLIYHTGLSRTVGVDNHERLWQKIQCPNAQRTPRAPQEHQKPEGAKLIKFSLLDFRIEETSDEFLIYPKADAKVPRKFRKERNEIGYFTSFLRAVSWIIAYVLQDKNRSQYEKMLVIEEALKSLLIIKKDLRDFDRDVPTESEEGSEANSLAERNVL